MEIVQSQSKIDSESKFSHLSEGIQVFEELEEEEVDIVPYMYES